MRDAVRYKPSNTGVEKEAKVYALRLNAMYMKETFWSAVYLKR